MARRTAPAWLLAWAAVAALAEGFPEHYGADAGGTRYAPLSQITPANVGDLSAAWTYRSGDLARRSEQVMRRSKFQVTPILAGDRLVLCTPFNEVVALDPGSGAELWRFDPKIRTDYRPANLFNCRGVELWRDPAAKAGAVCAARIFTATNDARLIALDLASGKPCADFGEKGEIRVDIGKPLLGPGEWQITSSPVAAAGVVIVGSAINDNQRVASPRGTVHAYDARTGKPRWQWDPIPRDAADPAAKTWGEGWKETGSANVWAPMSVDTARALVFLPTSSASPDFYGGLRPGANLHANSVVALRLENGAMAWSFQTVHHDVWDYDVPAQPTLATITVAGKPRDVVIAGNKQAMIFVLDRDTGKPVFPVEERAVPQGGATGEALSPTQPFPADLPLLAPSKLAPGDAWGITPWDRAKCRDRIAAARNDGLYTPPSEQGTILFPFTGGGINWGGIAIDPATDIVYANTSRLAHLVTLFPSAEIDAMRKRFPGLEVSPQAGAPFGMKRELLVSPLKLPCNPPPWGVLAALDLRSKRILWETNLGTLEEIAPLGVALHTGVPNFGGPLVTRGGLVFIGAALDRYLRGFDARTGAELWTARLPAAAIATPMSYEWQGRQYVVVAAGGRSDAGGTLGDAIVAFALPRPGDPVPGLLSRLIDRPGGRFGAGAALTVLLLALAAWAARRLSTSRRRAP
ncbi:MAG TPA: pyrroloquinoline quinone-dependent dehydrogenase [Burkholderiales bacterium]|nr:pyrroloquinoline quinone-dependent dehydrogenase [Burkholderiales bacterium]